MRATTILRALPPVPSKNDWPRTFPLRAFKVVNRLASNVFSQTLAKDGYRTNVTDPKYASQLVNSFDISPGTHVLEAYPGQ